MLLAFALSFFLFQLLIGVDSSVVDNTCYLGAYAVKDSPFNRCSGFRDCEKGYYCENGQRFLCPSGSFGAIARLSNSTCSGLCAAGYYCRDGSTIPTQNLCGNESVYCPIGSSLPLVSPPGYYTVDERELETLVSSKRRVAIQPCPFGHYCLNGIKTPCSGGSYGNSAQLSNIGCSGICPEGWFCPPGTVDPFSNPCSASAEFYCPKGTAVRQPTNTEYYAVLPHLDKGGGYGGQSICPRGSFCTKGIAYLCPGGRYGGKAGLTNANCTGPCEEGYYCPPGSVVSRPFACNAPNIYCPPESSHPLNVSTGYYTIGSNFANYSVIVDDGGNARLGITRVSQKPCDKGFYCLPDGTLD